MKVLLALILALNISAIKSYVLTHLVDIYQLNQKCVVHYFTHYDANVSGEGAYRSCSRDIRDLERSISQTIGGILEGEEQVDAKVRMCAVNLLEFYNVKTVVFKAFAYHQNLLEFTTNSQQSCKDVVKFNSTHTVECGDIKVMTVEPIGVNKSFVHLKHCLNDLFHEFQVDKIAFDDGEIFNRKFGKHLMEYLMQLSMMGLKYCESYEKVEVNSIEDLAGIDIFGLTEPSKRIEKCIADEIQMEKSSKLVNQILFENDFTMSRKRLIEITLNCLKEF